MTCDLVSASDGWMLMDEKPFGIEYNDSKQYRKKVLWFNNNEGVVKACSRHTRYSGCGEETTTFRKVNGKWIADDIGEAIVCSG